MDTKRKKLTDQFAREKSFSGETGSKLFDGVSIYVNGYTSTREFFRILASFKAKTVKQNELKLGLMGASFEPTARDEHKRDLFCVNASQRTVGLRVPRKNFLTDSITRIRVSSQDY